MAKLQTYKFVNPGVSNTKSPTVAAARRQTLALNRLGGTISGIGSVVSDIERISIRQIKNDKLRPLIDTYRKHNQPIMSEMIIALPGETASSWLDTIHYNPVSYTHLRAHET